MDSWEIMNQRKSDGIVEIPWEIIRHLHDTGGDSCRSLTGSRKCELSYSYIKIDVRECSKYFGLRLTDMP